MIFFLLIFRYFSKHIFYFLLLSPFSKCIFLISLISHNPILSFSPLYSPLPLRVEGEKASPGLWLMNASCFFHSFIDFFPPSSFYVLSLITNTNYIIFSLSHASFKVFSWITLKQHSLWGFLSLLIRTISFLFCWHTISRPLIFPGHQNKYLTPALTYPTLRRRLIPTIFPRI